MDLGCIKFDIDKAKKIDKIFKKYGILANFEKLIESLNLKYENKMKEYCDDYCSYFTINWKDCLEWKKKYKELGIPLKKNIIYIEGAFITTISVLKDIPYDFENKVNESCFMDVTIESIEHLEEVLKSFQQNLDLYIKLKNNADYIGWVKQRKKCSQDYETALNIRNEHMKKIDQGIDKLIKAMVDFT